jgi:hypothetical protein
VSSCAGTRLKADSAAENVTRKQLTPLQEAHRRRQLLACRLGGVII